MDPLHHFSGLPLDMLSTTRLRHAARLPAPLHGATESDGVHPDKRKKSWSYGYLN